VASFVFGLLFFVPFSFIAAIVFGHLALSEIKKSAGRLRGEGLAIAGLIFGYLWVVVIPVILIIAAIAIPNLLRARIVANESSAIASIRMLNTAEAAYAQAHSGGYTCSLSDLEQNRLTSRQLAGGTVRGYVFELRNCSGPGGGNEAAKYQVVGYPVVSNQTGIRAFCSDESAVIRVDAGGSSQTCLETGSPLQ
jgi:type II secretory pathway pseudopilin PulG